MDERDPDKNGDDGWAGVLYYNPEDRRTFVPRKYGIGVTINFGTLAGKIIGALMVMAISAIIIWGRSHH
jgi:uncharacterized membrane protein